MPEILSELSTGQILRNKCALALRIWKKFRGLKNPGNGELVEQFLDSLQQVEKDRNSDLLISLKKMLEINSDQLSLVAKFCDTVWSLKNASLEVQQRAQLSFAVKKLLKFPVLFTDRQNLRYLLYPNQNSSIYIDMNGNYEVDEEQLVSSIITPSDIIFDVGANIGIYTLLFSKLAYAGKVIAFEPEPVNHRHLLENIFLNSSKNVQVEALALADRQGSAMLNFFGEEFCAWHSLGRPRMPNPNNPQEIVEPKHQIEVPLTTLDSYCESQQVKQIDLLKIDVEGAELLVLKGASQLLQNGKVKNIMFEISKPQSESFNLSGLEIFEYLENFGYLFFLMKGKILQKVNKPYQNHLEHYQNFLAQLPTKN